MKKLIISLASGLILLSPAIAQEKVQKISKFKQNWYIQALGGASYTFSEGYKDASFGDLITPTVALGVGKEISPIVGVRLQGAWSQAKSQHSWQDSQYKYTYFQGSGDVLFNLTNIFLPYKQDRMFNLKAFAGLSAVHVKHKNNANINGHGERLEASNSIAPRLGLQADFALNNKVSLNLEVVGNLMNDDFNGVSDPSVATKYDGVVSAMAGITYNINKGFDYVDYIDPSTIDDLNGKLNQLRAANSQKDTEISTLQAELAKKPKVIEKVEEVEDIVMNALVVFKIGSAKLQDNQEINIFNAAKFFQDNPEYTCVITGYADKATGSAAVNQRISQQRADAVAKIMVDKFGISRDRIITQASGDKVQPFQNDAWNRVVIFNAVKKK